MPMRGQNGSTAFAQSRYAYKTEGTHNIVIADWREKDIYRVRKKTKQTTENTENEDDSVKDCLERILQYGDYVMTPLLGEEYVTMGSVVDLHGLPETADGAFCSVLGESCRYALKIPDCSFLPNDSHNCQLPTFCVEIKPNMLFIPPVLGRAGHGHLMRSVCRHCFTQRSKVLRGKWKEPCRSCPLDLASGNKGRMRTALRELLRVPHNRLKIFKNGEVIFGHEIQNNLDLLEVQLRPYFGAAGQLDEHSECTDILLDLLIKAVLHTPSNAESSSPTRGRNAQGYSLTKNCAESPYSLLNASIKHTRQPELPLGCALQRLQAAQLLGYSDMSSIYASYCRVAKHIREHSDASSCLLGPYDSPFWQSLGTSRHKDVSSFAHALEKVRDYMIFLTLRSCSIMVAIHPLCRPIAEVSNVLTDNLGRHYQFSLSVLDLDPKPMEKIENLYRQDTVDLGIYCNSFCSIGKCQQESGGLTECRTK